MVTQNKDHADAGMRYELTSGYNSKRKPNTFLRWYKFLNIKRMLNIFNSLYQLPDLTIAF